MNTSSNSFVVLSRIKSVFLQPFPEYLNNTLLLSAISIISVFAINEWNTILNFNVPIFRDDLINLSSDGYYWNNVQSEGRWLIFLFYNISSSISPLYCNIISYICLFYFFYICCRQFADIKWSLFFAAALLQSPSYYLIMLWPQTLLVNYILLATSAYFKYKIKPVYFFIIYGILFNGCLFNFYDLLPLLYLNDIGTKKINFYKFILIWIISFIIGHCFTQLIVFICFSQPLTLGNWRNPNYISCIKDIYHNLQTVFYSFYENCRGYGHISPFFILFSTTLGCIIYFLSNIKNIYFSCSQIIIILFVIVSLYIQNVPAGLEVNHHTAITLYAGILFFQIIISSRHILISTVIILMMTTSYFKCNIDFLNNWKNTGNIYYEEIKNIPVNPHLYKFIFLPATNQITAVNKLIAENNKLGTIWYTSPAIFIPVIKTAGYSTIHFGSKTQKILADNPNLQFINSGLFAYAIRGDNLFVKFSSQFCNLEPVHPAGEWSD